VRERTDSRGPGRDHRRLMSATAAYRQYIPLGVGILAVIGIVAALYLARAFFVPLLIGILASYALRPFVDWLKALRIPRAAGAALVLGVIVAGLSWAVVSLGDDATAIVASLPDAARKVMDARRRSQGPTRCRRSSRQPPSYRGRQPTHRRRGGLENPPFPPHPPPRRARGCATTCWRSPRC
jgi:hypothetical protein